MTGYSGVSRALYLYRASWRIPVLRRGLGRQLVVQSFDVRAALYGDRFEPQPFEVVLIDYGPELGAAVHRLRTRRSKPFPVIALTDDAAVQAAGAYAQGASVVEPFPPDPAVIEAVLDIRPNGRDLPSYGADPRGDGPRETIALDEPPTSPAAVDAGESIPARHRIVLDSARHECWIDGRKVHLAELPFRLLEYLITRDGACCGRQELLDEIWGVDYVSGSDVVSNTVKRLRRTLRPIGLHEHIQTIRNVGYKMLLDE